MWAGRKYEADLKPKYEIIFNDNVSEQIKVNIYFIMNCQEREKYEKKNKEKGTKHDVILNNSGPLYSVIENSNGQK